MGMNNIFNKKISELLGKMDEKMLQAKINAALDMLQNGDPEELAKKIKKLDKEEIMQKIDEYDKEKIKSLNINIDEIKQKVTEADFEKLSALIGENGDEIVKKIKTLLNSY